MLPTIVEILLTGTAWSMIVGTVLVIPIAFVFRSHNGNTGDNDGDDLMRPDAFRAATTGSPFIGDDYPGNDPPANKDTPCRTQDTPQ